MQITKIQVQNYRLLKNFSLDLEDDLSLVVGKNNCGKTSILSILDKFLNNKGFTFEDFNLDFKEELKLLIVKPNLSEDELKKVNLSLKLFIEYKDGDSLENVSRLMMDLDPSNNQIELLFEYSPSFATFSNLRRDYVEFEAEDSKQKTPKGIEFFLRENYQSYFKIIKKTLDPSDSNRFIDLEKEKISLKNVINYQYIKANRDVSNKENDKSLSGLSSSIYEKIEADDVHQAKIDCFKDELHKTDDSLNKVYEGIFESSILKVKKFGGLKPDDTQISITSTLQHKDLLKGNTTVLYKHNEDFLPEHYNGLGYMNLISMIFEIEILVNEFKRPENELPADINLLFIEEPEAHTHPQMQYVFIKNIKALLSEEADLKGKLQYVITTHSAHIVSESDFEDIKYLKREKDENSVIANNLKDLKKEYEDAGEIRNYKFLKQYLTLHRAELFFADKAIFIEGDTERILLPAIMKKVDQDNPGDPLLSQNISIIETGAYSHIFEKFINFIGVKSLVITDIDSAKEDKNKCKVSAPDAKITTNESLRYYYDTEKLEDFKEKGISEMVLAKDPSTSKWIKKTDGFLVCVYQTKEKNSNDLEYHASSFEDAFFHLNHQFILDDLNDAFRGLIGDRKKGLKNIDDFKDTTKDAYDLANNCVNKKTSFALEILLNSKEERGSQGEKLEFTNWQTPNYINQGLLWLKS